MNNKLQQIKTKFQELITADAKMEVFGSNEDWGGHHYELNEVLSVEQVSAIENKYGFQLPEEYKLYLTEIADGGAGPFYGLYDLEKAIQSSIERFTEPHASDDGAFAKDYNYADKEVKDWLKNYDEKIAEGEDDEIVNLDSPDNVYGIIYLSEYGCGGYYVLVVKGDQTGTVWFHQEGEYLFPCFANKKQWGFFDWFNNWLDESLKQITKVETVAGPAENSYSATILNYDGQQLEGIPDEVYKYKNLKKLVFSRNKLQTFPIRLIELSALRHLDLNMNPIVDIDPAIGELKNLRKLDLSYNHHTTLPESLAELESLEELRLVYTPKLVQFPDVVCKMDKLKKLSLYCSAIEKIPDTISGMTHLESLELDSNPITQLPDSIGELTKLKYLGLKYTKLKKLPEGIKKLVNLETLNLCIGGFELEDAIEKIKDLPLLVNLTIALKSSMPENLLQLTHVKNLSVEINFQEDPEPEKIDSNIFLLPNLERIVLDLNGQYETFPDTLFQAKKLKELVFSSTNIQEIPEAIKELKYLEKIIPSNHITQEMKAKVESWFPKMKWW